VFSKTYCPFCTATINMFKEMNVDAEVIEMDVIKSGDLIQDELHKMTGQRSVPNVFVNGQHVGGNDATQAAARSGKLQELLN
jgi:glutaredoxin